MENNFWLNLITTLVRELFHWAESPTSPRQKNSVRESNATQLPIQKIIALIEQNGSTQGLDLSGWDLSHADLSFEAVQRELQKRGYEAGQPLPNWISPFAARGERGMKLKEVNLQGANLRFADLQGADFSRANLIDADLRDARLQYCNFFQANLHRARLWRANLGHATFHGAKLPQTSLYRAEFENTDFQDAELTTTLLHRTDLSKVIVRRNSFPNRLIFEKPHEYAALVKWDDPEITPIEWEREVLRHLERGRDAYRSLKAGFSSNGMYADASWAYFRERVLERKMHAPSQVMLYYGHTIQGKRLYLIRYLFLHLKHLLTWFGYWLEELSCGYGEKPMRALGLGSIIILLFMPFYQLSGGLAGKENAVLSWLDILIYSMSTFATVSLPRFAVINPLAEFLTSLEALLGIAILALLMFALGNRIGRS